MPFKIVQTIEKGEVCLSIVPAGWESNGTLFWPKKGALSRLLLDEHSIPSSTWETINCVKKRQLSTRAEADAELLKMEGVSDTEGDETPCFLQQPTKKARIQTSGKATRDCVIDLNHLVQHPGSSAQEGNALLTFADQQLEPQMMLIEEGAPNEAIGQNVVIIPQIPSTEKSQLPIVASAEDVHSILNNQTKILENQTTMMDNQIRMMHSIAILQTNQNCLMKTIMDGNAYGGAEQAIAEAERALSKPMNSIDDLNYLEEALKDPVIFQKFVSNLSFICGSSGKANGLDCCYKIIDVFMTREFLTECSWTGCSRSTADENRSDNLPGGEYHDGKIALKFYKNIRTLFLKLVRLADKDFTEIECETFFKRVMKNSKQRLLVKSKSTHKNRPKNLKYVAQKPGSESGGCSKPDDEIGGPSKADEGNGNNVEDGNGGKE